MENTNTIDIHENAITCDYIVYCDKGYYFKGHNGARYKLVYFTYANEWSDREHTIYAKTLDALLAKYDRATKRLNDMTDDGETTTEQLIYELLAE